MKTTSGSYCIGLMLFVLLGASHGAEAPVGRWSNNTLVLDNGAVQRKIVFDAKKRAIRTTELKLAGDDFNFLGRSPAPEFSFEIDGNVCRGDSGWEVASVTPASAELDGRGAAVVLRSAGANPAKVEITIEYLLYPKLPVIRKKLALKNLAEKEVKLESLDVENLRYYTRAGDAVHVYGNYARRARVGEFVGDRYDSLVAAHDLTRRCGIALGNEAPGYMKRTTMFIDGTSLSIGLTHKDQVMPFRKWLKPGETWESAWAFICPYADAPGPEKVLFGPVADFVRRHLGIRAAELQGKPQFAFNTWFPFKDRISEKLILELVEGAAECGAKDFQIDAGWHRNENSPPNDPWWSALGDYLVDEKKFPRGLKPVFARVRELGMRPGLWMSLATMSKKSRVFREHPEWAIRDRQGRPAYMHSDMSAYEDMYTACLTTGWYDHVKAAMTKQISENGLKYIKIDLAMITGAYRFDEENFGCFAKDHPHKDREESLLMIYRRAWQLFDELHTTFPELYIDLSFEAAGDWQLIDLDQCKHAHGNWLHNCYDPPPGGCLRQRNVGWWVSPAIPAPAVLLGCMKMDNPQTDFMVGSLAGTVPLMLGDPRKLTAEQKARYRQWSAWLDGAQKKHDYALFRQDLPDFGEPLEGAWDGWQRINTETRSGGLVGVFRQGSLDSQRTVHVLRLEPDRIYCVRRGPDGREVAKLTGKELESRGFTVQFEQPFDGAVFEIDRE
jgi:alpha-galactosidase